MKTADLLEAAGRDAEARAVLERGLAYFEANRERYWPRLNEGDEERFRRKALDIYRGYTEGALRLSVELERLVAIDCGDPAGQDARTEEDRPCRSALWQD